MNAPRPSRTRSVVALVLRCELRQLLRDRRALFAAVLLPALLYPLVFWSQQQLEESSREILAAREVRIALDLSRADAAVADRARALLEQRTPIQVFETDADELFDFDAERAAALDPDVSLARQRALVQDLVGGGHVLVTGQQHPAADSRTLFRIYFDVKDDEAREAAQRAEDALDELDRELTLARRSSLLAVDPARGLDVKAVDVASAADASGAQLGRLLPLLAVLVLLSGGSYAALAVFAGERESGTLETLLVQPVSAAAVVRGKFAAVLVAGLVTLICNLGSIVACVAAGLGGLPGIDVGADGVGLLRLVGGLIYFPGCVLLCAILCLVCGRARTFREGQLTILPVMLLTALPTAVVLQPAVETTPLLAAVPFTGPALALRDALAGSLGLVPALVMVVSHLGWSALALSRLAGVLDAERVLSHRDTEAESAQRHTHSRHALRWGFASILALYGVGGWLQSWDFEWGLALTFWVLLPLLTLGCAWRGARRTGRSAWPDLALGRPAAAHLVGALLLVPGLGWLMVHQLFPLQTHLLPMPESVGEAARGLASALETMASPRLFLLMALSPGIFEELLFRGPILWALRRDLSGPRAVLWQALLFAAAHVSIYRLIPTALMGVVLGTVTLRARSLWPAVVLHVGYDALLVLGGAGRLPFTESAWWTPAAWVALPVGVLLLALPGRKG